MSDTAQQTHTSDLPSAAAAKNPPRPATWPWWLAAWIIAAIYTIAYAGMISKHTAIPYWDQTNYVSKTYYLASQWHDSGWRERFSPRTYLAAPPAVRPPLMMMLPAVLWRRHTTDQEMASCWLLERMAFLMLALWTLARIVGNARWVPAALCVILASHSFLTLDPSLYLMDLPFASVALLSAALAGYALQRRTILSCILAAIATIALFLVKPQGLAYMFPFMAVLAIERTIYEFRSQWHLSAIGNSKTRQRLRFTAWSFVLVVLLGAIFYVFRSPYGEAVKIQYAWGQQGYWNTALTWGLLRQILPGVLPPWLIPALFIAAVVALIRKLRRQPAKTTPPDGMIGLLIMFIAAITFWLLFSIFMTYAIDPRIVWSIMPLAICVAMILIAQQRWLRIAVTAAAAILFALAIPVATLGAPWQEIPNPQLILGPRIVQQHPVPEVGEMELARQVEEQVRGNAGAAGSQPSIPKYQAVPVMVLTCQEYLEYAGLTLAARWQNQDAWSATIYQPFPFGDDGFDISKQFDVAQFQWFITQSDYISLGVPARALVNMQAMASLITDPASPIHQAFEKRITVPITVPLIAEPGARPAASPEEYQWQSEKAVLWRLTRPLTPKELQASAAFILPRYKGTIGEDRMKTELEKLEKGAATTQ